jgi:hypothetical protein
MPGGDESGLAEFLAKEASGRQTRREDHGLRAGRPVVAFLFAASVMTAATPVGASR